jgi:sulfate adenylyltransferase subunit 2
MQHLDALENKSIYLIREAHSRFKKKALLWSMGKDSSALLWLCRKAFFGNIPFPVIHIDTSYKFKEIYTFRKKYSRQWKLNLIISRNEKALKEGMNHRLGRFECCNQLKTEALKMIIAKYELQALLLAIRRDEHGIRAKERFFSPRNIDQRWDYQNQLPELWDLYKSEKSSTQHFRVHPMLHWSELDVWEYIKREKIPIVPLYLAKKGQRYRSIGCETCCSPAQSNADSIPKIIKELKTTSTSERSDRAQDKEDAYTMQKLRSLGYM